MPEVQPRPTVIHGAPPVASRPITPERYISPQWLELEWAELWPKVWIFACLERDVAQVGDYQVFNLGRESILISRTQDGELAAFYNVCQHRGARVATDSGGCTKAFTCPYHGWSYRLDGSLLVVPDNQRFPNGGVNRAERSMPKVKVDSVAGMVFVSMNEHIAPLREWLGGVVDRIEPYHVESMTMIEDQTVSLDCNWKAVFDNFGELYHVEHIHPLHELQFDCPTALLDLYGNGHTGVSIDGHTVNTKLPLPDDPTPYLTRRLKFFGEDPAAYKGRVLEIRKVIQKLRREQGPAQGYDYSEFSDERLSDVEQYNMFPNTMITIQPDDALIMRARPHPTDPNKCWWDKFTFHRQADPKVAEKAGVPFTLKDPMGLDPRPRPPHDEFTQEEIISGEKTMGITVDQDVHFIRDVQNGMHSRGFRAQLLNSDEERIQHYHDWYDAIMGLR